MFRRRGRCPSCRRQYPWGTIVCPACHVALDLVRDPAPAAPEVTVFEMGDRKTHMKHKRLSPNFPREAAKDAEAEDIGPSRDTYFTGSLVACSLGSGESGGAP